MEYPRTAFPPYQNIFVGQLSVPVHAEMPWSEPMVVNLYILASMVITFRKAFFHFFDILYSVNCQLLSQTLLNMFKSGRLLCITYVFCTQMEKNI